MAGIALLGAGIFAREEHLPAIEATPALSLKAVYSRSQSSAEALASASRSPSTVAIYFDSPAVPGKSLDDLLQRTDIAAVDVVLPILQQPDVIRKALQAGKHVLSEKPVAGDVKGARELIAWYGGLQQGGRPLWGVAENWRYMESLRYAGEKVKEIGGELVTFRLSKYGSIAVGNKYLETAWRKTPSHQGGFLLDGGVHFVAGLRYLLAAAGDELVQVSGYSTLLDPKLVPVDTVHAAATTKRGRSGTVAISFGTAHKNETELEIVTTKGVVGWNPTEARIRTGTGEEEKKAFAYSSGVVAEVAAFAKAIEEGKLEPLQSPEEALGDLLVLQGLLESGAGGAAVTAVGL
ncbi:oxidoreductase-like protein [Chaetomium sp. MPI-SDFR-AT-0129]|nr:oxidoreductase-like protein [Chaetomium sp. MPI-SDFR-AT-0129]